MEKFVGSVVDEPLRERLIISIDGKGAFRRFKDVLLAYPAERERWFSYRADLLHWHIQNWLEQHEIAADQRAAVGRGRSRRRSCRTVGRPVVHGTEAPGRGAAPPGARADRDDPGDRAADRDRVPRVLEAAQRRGPPGRRARADDADATIDVERAARPTPRDPPVEAAITPRSSQQAPALDADVVAELAVDALRAIRDDRRRALALAIARIVELVREGRVDPGIALPALAMACAHARGDPRLARRRELEAARYEIETLLPVPAPARAGTRRPRPSSCPTCRRRSHAQPRTATDELEVVPLGEPRHRREVRRQRAAVDDLEPRARRRARRRRARARTRAGVILCVDDAATSRPPGAMTSSARGDQLGVVAHRAPRLAAARGRARERRRIDHDHVERAPRSTNRASTLNASPTMCSGFSGSKPDAAKLRRARACAFAATSTAHDLGGAAGLRVDRDRAGVREQVEHAPAARPLADRAATLAQIGEQPGRQRRGDVDDELQVVLVDLELDRRRAAAHELGARPGAAPRRRATVSGAARRSPSARSSASSAS